MVRGHSQIHLPHSKAVGISVVGEGGGGGFEAIFPSDSKNTSSRLINSEVFFWHPNPNVDVYQTHCFRSRYHDIVISEVIALDFQDSWSYNTKEIDL